MTITDILCFVAISLYAVRTAIFAFGAWLERKNYQAVLYPAAERSSSAPLFVSVVVPARNEEENIERCVRSIMASTYPHDTFEVLVVNDRSTDATAEKLRQLQAEFPQLVVLTLTDAEFTLDTATKPNNLLSNLQGKPRALHHGILRTRGEIVMMTDADCTVQAEWISHVAALFQNPDIALVPSYTVVRARRFFDYLQSVEWVFNHTMASAGIGLKQPLGCFGNNLSVRRSVYDALGGYDRIPFSVTEDLALLQAVANSNRQIRYVCDYGMKVTTLPCPDIRSFLKQHHRWANGGKALGWRATVFVASSAAIWLGIITALLSMTWLWLACILVVRAIADFVVINPALRILKMGWLRMWFFAAIPFLLLLELITPFFLLKSSVEWKNQTLNS